MLRKLAPLAAVLALAGCGAVASANTSITPPAAGTRTPAAAPAGLLKSTADDYLSALLRGDGLGATAYLAPKCTDDDKASLLIAASMVKTTANGATMTVTAVDVQGDRGAVTGYSYSANAPAALKRLVESSGNGSHDWSYADGKWSLDASCGPTPTPTPTP
jgi:hypothetical protein